MKLIKLLSLFLMLILSTKTVSGQYILRTPSKEIVLTKEQENKILQLLVEKELLYLTIEDKDLEINYLKNKQMENFKLIQSIMETNEKLQNSVLNLSKKIDMQNQEIGQLKMEVAVKSKRLKFFQITTAVTGGIILLIFVM